MLSLLLQSWQVAFPLVVSPLPSLACQPPRCLGCCSARTRSTRTTPSNRRFKSTQGNCDFKGNSLLMSRKSRSEFIGELLPYVFYSLTNQRTKNKIIVTCCLSPATTNRDCQSWLTNDASGSFHVRWIDWWHCGQQKSRVQSSGLSAWCLHSVPTMLNPNYNS